MSIGSRVRAMFGRHERFISELWRAGFIDLDSFFRQVRDWAPAPERILEIGCGEGAGTERLATVFPDASILAIDIADNLGRLYCGREAGVMFMRTPVTELVGEHVGKFDLVIMCDVLHHIPETLRGEVIASARALLAPDGKFVLKDWARTPTPIHWIAYAADRWLTGDRIRYLTAAEAEGLLTRSFTSSTIEARSKVRPWRNNYALLVSAAA